MTGRKPARRSGRRVLLIVSAMFVASAAVRFWSGPGMAIALDLVEPPAATASSESKEADIAPELVELLLAVKAREEAVMQKEGDIEARMKVLALLEDEVKKDIELLDVAEAELRATIATANQAAETDLARLTAVYENMKAEQAAALFQMMEPSFAAGFLGRMRPDAAAEILAGLEPELAYSISVVLAGRNAGVPVEPIRE